MRYVLFSLLVVILINGCSKDEPGSPPPTVVSYNPPSAEAGATVLITGTNFSTTAGDNTVSFNGTAATVTASTATTITTTVPVGATTGTVTVTVSEQTGTGPEFTVVPPPPTVVSYNPPSAEAGATVLITGTNFSTTAGDNTVSFNGTVAIVTASTATTITTTVPVGATTGTVTVTVSEQTGTGPEFTVVDPLAPTVVSYNPPSARAGATVLITGTNFSTTAGDNTVSFNGTTATVTASTATTITTTVPVGATTGTVTVTVDGKTATGPEFTVVDPLAPTVVSYNPPSAEAGATVLITGTNFSTTAGDNTVSFNGTAATVTASTATTITTTVPVGATTGTVTVTVDGKTGTGSEFTVVDPLAPTVVSYNPPSARAGATVLITGTNFSTTAGDNTVSFNGTAATVTASTATTITTTVPVGATTGTVTVTVDGKTATGPEFTVVVPPPPTVVSYNPPSARAGATVLITGTNFSTTAGDNTVSFNGTAATVTASTATTITTTVPVGATTGTVTVTVDGKTGTGSEFTVVVPPPPTVVSYNPPSARAEETVIITGTNFSTTAGDNTVSFNGIATTVTASTATTITTTVPVGKNTTGPVTVTVNGKTGTGPGFTVIVPTGPVDISISPLSYDYGEVSPSLGSPPRATFTVTNNEASRQAAITSIDIDGYGKCVVCCFSYFSDRANQRPTEW